MKSKVVKIILTVILSILISISLLFAYGYFIGTKGLKVKEYKIGDQNLPTNFYGLKIVHISDIHYGFFFDTKKLEKVVDKVNSLNPDIVVLTGDLIDIDPKEQEKEEIIKLLSGIKAKIGKFAIKGNLDTNCFSEIITKSGFTDLNNNYNIIYSKSGNLMIAGLSSNLDDKETIDNKLNNIYSYIDENEINYKILIMHEPDYIEKVKNNTFNLVLAGHSHNGQINLPLFGVIRTPKGSKKYYKEYYETNNGKLYISSGIGTSVIPIRLFNKPSINFYRLVNK